MGSDPSDIRVLVDEFLSAEKSLTGSGNFSPTEQPDEYEWRRFIVHDGAVADAQLLIIAYPDSPDREFRLLVLHSDACIARLDFVFKRDGPHINDLRRPMGYPSTPIWAPHYHPWSGNRQLATVDKYPKKLLYAYEIDNKINGLSRAFKWFCNEVKIAFTSNDVPDWPSRERLL